MWDGNRLLNENRDLITQTYIYEQFGFIPVASLDDTNNINYYHTDHLGTPRELTNEKGEIIWEAVYDTWGNTKESSKSNDDIISIQPLRFQGQYYDTETGLHYNRFRYYDPDIGRFVSQDPIGLLGGDNLYAYAPNPTGWIDPFGLARKGLKNRLPEGKKGILGPKNGTLIQKNPETGDIIQIRNYDRDGKPISDIDFGHNHGAGDPHSHDWEYPSKQAPNKQRQDGRELTSEEIEKVKSYECDS